MQFELNTEGVLLVCSTKSLFERYSSQSFNYDFPDGILDNINAGELLAAVNVSGDPIRVTLRIDEDLQLEKEWEDVAVFHLQVKEEDRLTLLSHAEFTQICSSHKGNINNYDFFEPQKFIDNLSVGWHEVEVFARELDFEEEEVYSEILLSFTNAGQLEFPANLKSIPSF